MNKIKEYRQKTWRKNNHERNAEHQKKYKKTSLHWKEYWKDYMKQYYWKHREKINAQKRERYALRRIQS